ncbi:MAG: ABC transporter permease [Methanobrevibacter sp.]|uniref:ABC transporter permease n=1 Tax=Methanobrevibacter sp. TaxID=66852 RepID=UPI0026DFAA9C|nr:ABC transporter permease [Methanobrevibacter sp.]MDO5848435.1 ABC transporter permease [Methanobrevibacter sp.]
MSFLSLILKNPFRNRTRAFLAIVGIGIGIATIVALGGITDGLIASAEDTLHSGGTDITITGSSSTSVSDQSSMFGTTKLNESWVDKIKKEKGVTEAVGVYSSTIPHDNKIMSLVGINPSDVKFAELNIIKGHIFADSDAKEIIAGKVTAETNNVTVGDEITIGDETFKVVGIFESGNSNQDMSYFMTLDNMQDLMDDEGNISSIFVKVDPKMEPEEVGDALEDKYDDNITVISSLSDLGMAKDLIDMLHGVSFGISLLAIVIGGVGIINTMLMSVLERTREIGVLKAVGWSNKKILMMIIAESIVLTVAAAIVGTIVGIIGVEIFMSLNILGGMSAIFTPQTIVEAFSIAIIVGIIGGVYPAIKAVRLPPTEALRYE